MTKVLIVEDDELIAEGMAQHLAAAGLDPVRVGAGEIGLARLRYERPDVLVLDLMLPGLDGWGLIETARAEGIGTPIVVVSARHQARPACTRSRSAPTTAWSAVLDEGARRASRQRHGAACAGSSNNATRSRDRGAADRPALGRRSSRRAAGLTPTEFRLLYTLALTRAGWRPGPAAAADLRGAARPVATGQSTSASAAAAEKIDRRAPRHTFIQTRYGVGYKLEPLPK